MSELKGNIATKGALKGNLHAVYGKDGKSAYEIALDNGFEGTETEWLESLHGEKGDKGDIGEAFTYEDFTQEQLASLKGDKGDRGEKGDTGNSGVYLGSGDMPDGYNVQIDPTGDPVVIPKEEWITIADITTTEDVKQIEFATDTNGNPFLCKEIFCQVIFPQNHFTDFVGITWGYDAGWRCMYTSFAKENHFFDCSMRCLKEGVAAFTSNQKGTGENYIGWGEGSMGIRCDVPFPATLDRWVLFNYGDGTNVNSFFPTGTKIKVWGLKA